jgi:2,3-bisphosphoglycerate-independent phosphoglycerate mutase
VFFNFRPDRAREITRAFTDPTFEGFERPLFPKVRFVCLTEYDPTIPAPVAFAKEFPKNVLADVLAEQGLTQLHIAETEKYAHVTFFFNGGAETPKLGETRVLVASPKVATYELQPEMSEPEVTERLVDAIGRGDADVYIVNYANCDMVGHTGVFEAAVRAVEAVDEGVGAVVSAIRARGGVALITADHGNAEAMVDPDGHTPFTAHTLDPVPLVVIADGIRSLDPGGKLADVAPTLLDLIGLEMPAEWTGRSLLLY